MAVIVHEELNEMDGAWWKHGWAGIYFGLLADMGYEPEDEHGQPRYRLFFVPPGGWRIEPIAPAEPQA